MTAGPSRHSLLPQTAEYALRAMAILAALGEGHAARADDIAAASGVPRAYVSKILRRLVVANLVVSQKGHGGGFCLARPAAAVRVLDILDAVDVVIADDGCAFGWGVCNAAQPCPMHPVWVQMKAQFTQWAEGTTLEAFDLARAASLLRPGV